MDRFTLYTYNGRKEFEKLYSDYNGRGINLYYFEFGNTQEILKNNTEIVLNISNLIPYIDSCPSNIVSVEVNLKHIDDKTMVIVDEKYAEKTLDLLYNIFDEIKPLNLIERIEKSIIESYIPLKRKKLYFYDSAEQTTQIIEYCNTNNKLYINFAKLNNSLISELNKKNQYAIIDITSIAWAYERNNDTVYLLEQMLNTLKDYDVLIRKDLIDIALDKYVMLFNDSASVKELLDKIQLKKKRSKNSENKDNISKIVTVSNEKLEDIKDLLKNELCGHIAFKELFINKLENFIKLNKINKKKVLSVFLLGGTGLGKTEVARILKKGLDKSTTLIKINFGNYSSKDALNSLIGSPKGYIGCESGELSTKLLRSSAGIILCDEFEKAQPAIFNFFLELLEDGQFTDSMSNEHDIDGYIIIFTSNISEEEYYRDIPQEFQSRIDMVCEFTDLGIDEKKQYATSYLEELISEINENNIKLSTQQYNSILNIDFTNKNIRDIKRIIEDKLLKII